MGGKGVTTWDQPLTYCLRAEDSGPRNPEGTCVGLLTEWEGRVAAGGSGGKAGSDTCMRVCVNVCMVVFVHIFTYWSKYICSIY